jgi:protein-glutamine gamma-glutamyltransferase
MKKAAGPRHAIRTVASRWPGGLTYHKRRKGKGPVRVMDKLKSLFQSESWRHERPIDLLVAIMAALATMLLGASYHAPLAVWLSLLLVAASVYLNDITGWLRLDRKWASRVSLAAVVVWCVKAQLLSGDWQLAAISYVLLILQIVLLFQAKSNRIVWQCMLLSVGLVAVAAGLSPGLWFGPLLIIYTLVGLTALALLGMDHSLALAGLPGVGKPALEAALIAGNGVVPEGAIPAGISSDASMLRFSANPVAWSRPQWRRTLARQIGGMTAAALMMTMVVFFLVPRVARKPEEIFEDAVRSVGYSHDVTLGDEAGQALQNPDVVLRIKFFDEPAHVPVELIGEPLLRGSVATEYEGGRWRQHPSRKTRELKQLNSNRYVRQQISIEPFDEPTLFAVFPAELVVHEGGIGFDELGGELSRHKSQQYQQFEYELGTLAIQNRVQIPLVPLDDSRLPALAELLQMPLKSEAGADPLAGLRAQADAVREQAQLAPEQHYEIAKALTKYLRESGAFEYSDLGQKRTMGIDPIEDFVTDHRRGHCEYFAGALALMLRSQGIPARVAIGFRASEFNSAGSYYQVRQLHAHAWVEAMMRPEDYVDQELPKNLDWSRGGWLTLDPTAFGERVLDESFNHSLWRRANMYIDYLQVLWGRFVSGLNNTTQWESIYTPLAAFFARLWEEAQYIGWHWLSIVGALAAIAIVPRLARAASVRRLFGRIRWFTARAWPAVGPRASSHEIYGRLERVLARHGYQRTAGQTPYEFALAIGGDLAELPDGGPLAALPRRVVEAFYRVRFGRHPLDSAEVQAVEHALSTLERGLGQKSSGG